MPSPPCQSSFLKLLGRLVRRDFIPAAARIANLFLEEGAWGAPGPYTEHL
jgi:hypothetical protein